MAYIGKQPIVGNYQVLDALTATTTDTYALTKNSVAVYPQTPANCIVSLNGVIQAPFDSYTISGSNIVFASALTASDSIDFITVLGDVLNVGTVSDGTIGISKLSATGTPSSSTFLRGDNSWVSAGGTNTPAFKAYLSTQQSFTTATNTKVTFQTELYDTNSCYDNSTNYRFTPTSAGKYFLTAKVRFETPSTSNNAQLRIVKNGNSSDLTPPNAIFTSNPNLAYTTMFVSGVLEANGSTDYFEIFSYQDTGSSVPMSASFGSSFEGFKIIE